ncbi:hypothetical protein BIU82_00255 [Arthrobacter sp. SW1]|uniref:hypothetical protein n=1 Tax=Arthrobacter sp. SW1 TaxID=1920889 RepID=UPI000877B2E0|nr:hypothetical protein [Arthrobacter sp. SW1]OFI39549.1 hypothetical protein BIU82_00255 [Arthrobacter sp. SW1]
MEQHPHYEPNDPEESLRSFIRNGLIEHAPSTDHEFDESLTLLNALLQSDCARAHEACTPLAPDTARGIAAVLACALPPHSALIDFADGAEPDYPKLWDEVGQLRRRSLRPKASEYLTWLTGHLIASQLPELAPSRPPRPDTGGTHFIAADNALGLILALHSPTCRDSRPTRDKLFEAGVNLALNYGTPAVAFLRIPTVDAAQPDLEEAFNKAHYGSFDSLEDIFDTFFQVITVDTDQQHRHPYCAVNDEERQSMHRKLGTRFQIVEAGGHFHLFLRDV